ncbi:MAG: glycosyltransferase family 4 protein [Thermomicrobiales bacterium]|nr:glycosyltransferase family 4 protein [Thermomicrobiales bacterium]
MRFLHVNHRYAPFSGGSEIVVQRISEWLVQLGHDVTVVTSDTFDLEYFWEPQRKSIDAPQREQINGVEVVRVPVRHLPASSILFRGSRRMMGEVSRLPIPATPFRLASRVQPWMPDLRRTLMEIGPVDAVLATNLGLESLAIAAFQAADRCGAARIVIPFVHLGGDNDPVARRYVTMPHQVAVLRAAHAVLTMTEQERDFIASLDVAESRIVVTGAGADADKVTGGDGGRIRTSLDLDGFVVGSLGPPSPEKGTPDLVRAVAALRREGRNVHLVLAGPPLSHFSSWFDSLSPEDRDGIHLLGYIDADARRDLLAGIDAFALPSRTESFGIVYLEAWLNQKPVIAARAGAVPELVRDNETGMLVPFGDPESIAVAIRRLMDDDGVAARLATNGYHLARSTYAWPDVLARVQQGYEIALGRRIAVTEGSIDDASTATG